MTRAAWRRLFQCIVLLTFLVTATDLALAKADAQNQGLPEPPAGKAWTQVWHDEFNGNHLDADKWQVRTGPRRDGVWSADNISVKDGQLILKAESADGKYTTGAIWSRDRFQQQYGLFVIRAKLPREKGHWVGFWLYSDSVKNVGDEGRDGTEMDIMEQVSMKRRIQHALHWDGYGEFHKQVKKEIALANPDGYHVYALWWTPTEYHFYVDGVETWTTTDGGISQVPEFIQITDEIAPWAGDIRNAHLPDYFYVDYVRVYVLKSSP